MQTKEKNKLAHYAPTFFLSLLLAISIFYFYQKSLESFGKPPPDAIIFLNHGQQFFKTGSLYDRPNDHETLEFIYRPASSSYKFPPAFQLLILPFAKNPSALATEQIIGYTLPRNDAFDPTRSTAYLLYAIAWAATLATIRKTPIKCTPIKQINIMLVLCILLFSSDSFFKQLYYMNAEIIIFFGLSIAGMLLCTFPFAAGFLCGILASVKIYPLIISFFFIITARLRAFFGFAASTVLTLVSGLAVFGKNENIFYFSELLPVILREPLWTAFFNTSLENLASYFMSETAVSYTAIPLKGLIFFATIFILYQNRTRNDTLVYQFGLILLAMLLMIKNLWSSYLMLAALPAMLFGQYAICHPRVDRSIMLATLFLLLAVDMDWALQIQYVREIIRDNPDKLPEYWESLPPYQRAIKQALFMQPWLQSCIFWCNACKGAVPLILWIWLAGMLRNQQKMTD